MIERANCAAAWTTSSMLPAGAAPWTIWPGLDMGDALPPSGCSAVEIQAVASIWLAYQNGETGT